MTTNADSGGHEFYNVEWFRSLGRYREWNERAMWAAFAHLGKPESFADFGCGDGWMVRTARLTGAKPAIGIEGYDSVKSVRPDWARIMVHDLSTRLDLERQYDVVVSIETGEHIPYEKAAVYVDNLVRHTKHWLVFTAAAPGQGGEGHINCQPQEYWRAMISSLGLMYNPEQTERLKETWKWCTGPMFWLPQNLQVFEREQRLVSANSSANVGGVQ